MFLDTKLTKDEERESIDSAKYRGMKGSLLYLTKSSPDNMFSVCLCACFQEDPKTFHLEALKCIFRYIKGTTHLGLWYPKGTGIETTGYADSDHAGDYVDRKSTSSICAFVGCCLTSWFSKKQIALTISRTEAEYVTSNVSQVHHPKQVLFIEGHCSFSNKWSLDNLEFSVPSRRIYQTAPPTPGDIKLYVQVDREEPLTRTRHGQNIDVEENQILTQEVQPIMKTWVDIICENIFCLGGNRDHILSCLCHMLNCIATSTKYNLAFFVAKRMKLVTKQARLILPYGMFLTRLFNHVMSNSPELSNDQHVLYDRVMYPLTAQHERKTQKDYGTKRGSHSTSTFSSSAFDHPSCR
nr:uncharacterized mitochondrial protein AtMg00810-like [Tanacetum cinerariifolium]